MAYSKEEIDRIFDEVLDDISQGSPAYKAIKGKLSSATFYDILEKDAEKANKYARACAQRADLIFEETLEIADDTSEDIVVIDDKPIENPKMVQRDKLRVETRKWFLSKLHPKKYGDKTEVDLNVNERDSVTKEEFLEKIRKAKSE